MSSSAHHLAIGRDVLSQEASALLAASFSLDTEFTKAVDLILNCQGRLFVTGIGKSGHIGSKLAATFASTGTPAYFVHAAEAAHGDLGMITPDDVVIAISYSGESSELAVIIPMLVRSGVKIIAMTGKPQSTLGAGADAVINCHVQREACPNNLAPTTSTTVTLALGDALAIACLSAKHFTAEDFARSHPGGALGRRLLLRLSDVMRSGNDVPRVTPDISVVEAIRVMSRKCMGMTAIVDTGDRVVGIFTEGDLRRLIERVGDVRDVLIADVMTHSPKVGYPQELAATAAKRLNEMRVNQLLIVDSNTQKLVGAVHIQDLMAAKVI